METRYITLNLHYDISYKSKRIKYWPAGYASDNFCVEYGCNLKQCCLFFTVCNSNQIPLVTIIKDLLLATSLITVDSITFHQIFLVHAWYHWSKDVNVLIISELEFHVYLALTNILCSISNNSCHLAMGNSVTPTDQTSKLDK